MSISAPDDTATATQRQARLAKIRAALAAANRTDGPIEPEQRLVDLLRLATRLAETTTKGTPRDR